MSRSLRYDIPGTDWRVDLDALVGARFDHADFGFGRGEFLLDLATRHPEQRFLGVEYSFKRVLKLARRLAKTELENVRLVQARAEDVVTVLPRASLFRATINFPDPWPKKRHHRRRLLQPVFVRDLAERLRPGGTLAVATDHVEYAEAIDLVLSGEPRLENLFAPDRYRTEVPGRTPTAYEREWRAEGRTCHFFEYGVKR